MSSAAAIAGEDFFLTMQYGLLKALLPHLEAYEIAHPNDADPQRFIAWLSLRQGGNATNETPQYAYDDLGVLQLSNFWYRYTRGYARKALEGTPLGSFDEYAYLDTLHHQGPMGKSALIQYQRHEKPTGMEIIKRLLELDFVAQTDDPSDRRSKKLHLTPKGKEVVETLAPTIQQVARLSSGNLSPIERVQLLHLLQKLETFHAVVQAKLR